MTTAAPSPVAERRFGVTTEDSAIALGSGDVPVLATPRLLAWAEAVTVDVVAQVIAAESDGSPDPVGAHALTSVGTRIEFTHERATAIGAEVVVSARLVARDGRLMRCEVVAHEDSVDGLRRIAHGEVTRVLVDRERFLARLSPPR
jgi:fluoroacetyl-CoA thioesterase